MSASSFLCVIVSYPFLKIVVSRAYRCDIRPLLAGLVIVSGLTSLEFCGRRRNSGESSERNCDLHVDDLVSLAMKL
jgi:hypothetical protein